MEQEKRQSGRIKQPSIRFQNDDYISPIEVSDIRNFHDDDVVKDLQGK
jgi:hypothetical protein